MYKLLLRPILFLLHPEKAHGLSFFLIKALGSLPLIRWIWKKIYVVQDPRLEREIFGLKFPNPIGLAAGFDKDAVLFEELACFGFGFIEIGTVTPRPQSGNPRPRLFRLTKDKGLINRMGFNNNGVKAASHRLEKNKGIIIGGNIGKNKDTPNSEALLDYIYCLDSLYPYVDYFVVNVSSPNTPGLRELQEKQPLKTLLNGLMGQLKTKAKLKPILLKVAPDLNEEQLLDVIQIVEETGISGIIATNTTLSREGLKSDPSLAEQNGGLSGKPLRQRSTEIIRFIHEKSKGRIPIIGVGGIHSPEDVMEKINAGAVLVQLYTGFIYEGPRIVHRINQALSRMDSPSPL